MRNLQPSRAILPPRFAAFGPSAPPAFPPKKGRNEGPVHKERMKGRNRKEVV